MPTLQCSATHVSMKRNVQEYFLTLDSFGEVPPKFLIGRMICMQFWAGYHIYHKHALFMNLQEQTKKAYRRTVPLVQAMEDVNFSHYRNAITWSSEQIATTLTQQVEPHALSLQSRRQIFSYYLITTMRAHYDGRFSCGHFWHPRSNRKPEDEKNLVKA